MRVRCGKMARDRIDTVGPFVNGALNPTAREHEPPPCTWVPGLWKPGGRGVNVRRRVALAGAIGRGVVIPAQAGIHARVLPGVRICGELRGCPPSRA